MEAVHAAGYGSCSPVIDTDVFAEVQVGIIEHYQHLNISSIITQNFKKLFTETEVSLTILRNLNFVEMIS
jgi:hypothetical protein